jgi:putative tricarboxylic transport membrane protein
MGARMTARQPIHLGELFISLGLLALGSFVIYDTQSIPDPQSAGGVGPRLFPYIIGIGLTLCGAVLGWHAISGGWRNVPLDQEGHDRPDWLAFGIISTGIVLHMIVIGWAGFIIASTLLFVLVARGFGSRRSVRDAIIAVVLAIVVYFVFTYGLGLKLPAGPFGAA